MVLPAVAEGALPAARARAEKETANRARFLQGEIGLDVYGMRPRLAEKGLVYYDTLADFEGRA